MNGVAMMTGLPITCDFVLMGRNVAFGTITTLHLFFDLPLDKACPGGLRPKTPLAMIFRRTFTQAGAQRQPGQVNAGLGCYRISLILNRDLDHFNECDWINYSQTFIISVSGCK
jgi:hypothetical protein